MILKILSPILLFTIGLVQVLLDYWPKWKDGRTKLNRIARVILVIIMLGLAIFSIINVVIDKEATENALRREGEAINARGRIETKLSSLQRDFQPIKEILAKYYPNKDIIDAINNLEKDLSIVKEKTNFLENRALPREITKQQDEIVFGNLLKGSKGKVQVGSISNSEAMIIAKKLRSIFIRAGWQVDTFAIVQGVPFQGIQIGSYDINDPVALNIKESLESIGYTAKIIRHSDKEKISVTVGEKEN